MEGKNGKKNEAQNKQPVEGTKAKEKKQEP
jgi:hypothetical protein